jgi:hypothetical protein
MKMLSSDEFDRRFDSGEDLEEFVDWSQKPVVIEPLQNSENSVYSVMLQFDKELFNKATVISNLMHLEKEKVLTKALSLGLAKMEKAV